MYMYRKKFWKDIYVYKDIYMYRKSLERYKMEKVSTGFYF